MHEENLQQWLSDTALQFLACVAGVKRGRRDSDARGRKERNACKETIVFFKTFPYLLCKHKLTVKCLVIK